MNTSMFKNNWKSILAVFAAISSIVTTSIVVDERYAHAVTVTTQFKVLNQQTHQLLTMMTSQLETRKTILELKQADGTITPTEVVELNNLVRLLHTPQ